MIYAWTLLGFLTIGVALLIFIGFRSRSRTEQYMSVPKDYVHKVKVRTAESRSIIIPETYDTTHRLYDEGHVANEQHTSSQPATNNQSITDDQPITGDQEIESEYEEALIMLREVKAMLLQGRPDRAIEHIRTATGVDHENARQFVSNVENKVIG